MDVSRLEWNAVVAASWNRAILTPNGIAKRIFNLAAGTPIGIELEVAMDQPIPPRVKHDGLVVIAENDKLIVAAQEAEFESLNRARQAAKRAVTSLPETPFRAVGLNIRHRVTDPTEEFLGAVSCVIDDKLADAGYEIGPRVVERTVGFGEGFINLRISKVDENIWETRINFHRDTTKGDEITAWLDTPLDNLEAETRKLLVEVLSLDGETV